MLDTLDINGTMTVRGMGCVLPGAMDCAAFDRLLRDPSAVPSKQDLGKGHTAYAFAYDDLGSYADRLAALSLPDAVVENGLRLGSRGSVTLGATLLAAAEAWAAADVGEGESVGLILAGNNLDPMSAHLASTTFADEGFASPLRGMTWLDGHLLGAVSEMLGLTGPGFQVGGSSAAGLIGTYQAMALCRAGLADTWLVVAPPMILSPVEFTALAGLGAMAGFDQDIAQLETLCAPFDQSAQGFVPGAGAGAIVVGPGGGGVTLVGGAVQLDAHARTEPNPGGEARTMCLALENARLRPDQIDYVNAHGTASRRGDAAEAEALEAVFATSSEQPWINATKAIQGHCLTSAGLIELIATCLQMKNGYLHGNPALRSPISERIRFVGASLQRMQVTHAICNSFAFGGVNAALVLSTGNNSRP